MERTKSKTKTWSSGYGQVMVTPHQSGLPTNISSTEMWPNPPKIRIHLKDIFWMIILEEMIPSADDQI